MPPLNLIENANKAFLPQPLFTNSGIKPTRFGKYVDSCFSAIGDNICQTIERGFNYAQGCIVLDREVVKANLRKIVDIIDTINDNSNNKNVFRDQLKEIILFKINVGIKINRENGSRKEGDEFKEGAPLYDFVSLKGFTLDTIDELERQIKELICQSEAEGTPDGLEEKLSRLKECLKNVKDRRWEEMFNNIKKSIEQENKKKASELHEKILSKPIINILDNPDKKDNIIKTLVDSFSDHIEDLRSEINYIRECDDLNNDDRLKIEEEIEKEIAKTEIDKTEFEKFLTEIDWDKISNSVKNGTLDEETKKISEKLFFYCDNNLSELSKFNEEEGGNFYKRIMYLILGYLQISGSFIPNPGHFQKQRIGQEYGYDVLNWLGGLPYDHAHEQEVANKAGSVAVQREKDIFEQHKTDLSNDSIGNERRRRARLDQLYSKPEKVAEQKAKEENAFRTAFNNAVLAYRTASGVPPSGLPPQVPKNNSTVIFDGVPDSTSTAVTPEFPSFKPTKLDPSQTGSAPSVGVQAANIPEEYLAGVTSENERLDRLIRGESSDSDGVTVAIEETEKLDNKIIRRQRRDGAGRESNEEAHSTGPQGVAPVASVSGSTNPSVNPREFLLQYYGNNRFDASGPDEIMRSVINIANPEGHHPEKNVVILLEKLHKEYLKHHNIDPKQFGDADNLWRFTASLLGHLSDNHIPEKWQRTDPLPFVKELSHRFSEMWHAYLNSLPRSIRSDVLAVATLKSIFYKAASAAVPLIDASDVRNTSNVNRYEIQVRVGSETYLDALKGKRLTNEILSIKEYAVLGKAWTDALEKPKDKDLALIEKALDYSNCLNISVNKSSPKDITNAFNKYNNDRKDEEERSNKIIIDTMLNPIDNKRENLIFDNFINELAKNYGYEPDEKISAWIEFTEFERVSCLDPERPDCPRNSEPWDRSLKDILNTDSKLSTITFHAKRDSNYTRLHGTTKVKITPHNILEKYKAKNSIYGETVKRSLPHIEFALVQKSLQSHNIQIYGNYYPPTTDNNPASRQAMVVRAEGEAGLQTYVAVTCKEGVPQASYVIGFTAKQATDYIHKHQNEFAINGKLDVNRIRLQNSDFHPLSPNIDEQIYEQMGAKARSDSRIELLEEKLDVGVRVMLKAMVNAIPGAQCVQAIHAKRVGTPDADPALPNDDPSLQPQDAAPPTGSDVFTICLNDIGALAAETAGKGIAGGIRYGVNYGRHLSSRGITRSIMWASQRSRQFRRAANAAAKIIVAAGPRRNVPRGGKVPTAVDPTLKQAAEYGAVNVNKMRTELGRHGPLGTATAAKVYGTDTTKTTKLSSAITSTQNSEKYGQNILKRKSQDVNIDGHKIYVIKEGKEQIKIISYEDKIYRIDELSNGEREMIPATPQQEHTFKQSPKNLAGDEWTNQAAILVRTDFEIDDKGISSIRQDELNYSLNKIDDKGQAYLEGETKFVLMKVGNKWVAVQPDAVHESDHGNGEWIWGGENQKNVARYKPYSISSAPINSEYYYQVMDTEGNLVLMPPVGASWDRTLPLIQAKSPDGKVISINWQEQVSIGKDGRLVVNRGGDLSYLEREGNDFELVKLSKNDEVAFLKSCGTGIVRAKRSPPGSALSGICKQSTSGLAFKVLPELRQHLQRVKQKVIDFNEEKSKLEDQIKNDKTLEKTLRVKIDEIANRLVIYGEEIDEVEKEVKYLTLPPLKSSLPAGAANAQVNYFSMDDATRKSYEDTVNNIINLFKTNPTEGRDQVKNMVTGNQPPSTWEITGRNLAHAQVEFINKQTGDVISKTRFNSISGIVDYNYWHDSYRGGDFGQTSGGQLFDQSDIGSFIASLTKPNMPPNTRDKDSEYKILHYINYLLKKNNGQYLIRVNLYTSLPLCASCAIAIQKFMERPASKCVELFIGHGN